MGFCIIRLEDGAEVTEQTDFGQDGWWVDDNIITVVSGGGDNKARYRLPRGKPRVVTVRLGSGRDQLNIGGFTTTTVSVVGPSKTIAALREAVL